MLKWGKTRWLNKKEEKDIKYEIYQYIKQGKIEEGVKDLVLGLNAISGVCTIESCEGHEKKCIKEPEVTHIQGNGTIWVRLNRELSYKFYDKTCVLQRNEDIDDLCIGFHRYGIAEYIEIYWKFGIDKKEFFDFVIDFFKGLLKLSNSEWIKKIRGIKAKVFVVYEGKNQRTYKNKKETIAEIRRLSKENISVTKICVWFEDKGHVIDISKLDDVWKG